MEGYGRVPSESSSLEDVLQPVSPPSRPLESSTATAAVDTSLHWHVFSEHCDLADVNYHEAAIYLREGENNDKFTAHPTSPQELPAYLTTHSTWFYTLDLFSSLLLMSLAIIEQPAIPHLSVQIWVHTSLELFGLLLISLELVMKMKWLGFKAYVTHIRTMFKTIVLLEMMVEAVTMMCRQQKHLRIIRAFRPIFILDSHYCKGTRRFMRQILQSLPPIIDMILLLFFFMLVFTLLGFHMFSGIEDDIYFNTIENSFLSLFILLTTANFPDVMMPSYNQNKFHCLFFIFYLIVELYFLMNLFLAVVYNSFSMMEKEKLKRLLLHKREACEKSFKLICNKENPTKITLKDFYGLMRFFKPKSNKYDVYMTYKALDLDCRGHLNINDFYNFYDVVHLRWKLKEEYKEWFLDLNTSTVKLLHCLRRLITWYWFDIFIYFVLFMNLLWLFVDTLMLSVAMSTSQEIDLIAHEFSSIGISITFISIYVLETIIKLLALGPREYFKSGWNLFDFCTILASSSGLLLELVDHDFYYLLVLRPVRLLRLFKLKQRLQDILATMSMLFKRMLSIGIVMLLLFYTFAIIGMEVFSGLDLENCCVNSTVEPYFSNSRSSGIPLYYYLNNFDNLFTSYVTLFELTVVNNWYVIMDGYAIVTNEWSRLYFITFYLITMVVLTVVVAFILEAFLFRIKYRQSMHGQDIKDDAVYKIDVAVNIAEYNLLDSSTVPDICRDHDTISTATRDTNTRVSEEYIWYEGIRNRTKDDFSIKMYKDELTDWIQEEHTRHHRNREYLRHRYGAIDH